MAKRRIEKLTLPPVKGRDIIHLEHVTNGFKEGAHGGDKRARRRRERRRAKLAPPDEE